MAQNITVINKATKAAATTTGATVSLSGYSVVQVPIAHDQIKSLARHGHDLVITTTDGQVIVVHGFFVDNPASGHNDLVLQDGGGLWLSHLGGIDGAWSADLSVDPAAGGVFSSIASTDSLLADTAATPSAAADSANSNLVWLPLAIAAGGLAAAISSNGTSSAGSSGALTLGPIEQNPNGTLTVSGHARPGATITVTYPDHSTNSGTAGTDGSFSVNSQGVQTTGAVSVTDNSGSTPVTQTWTDTTPPVQPSGTAFHVDPSSGHLVVAGTAEAGSTVKVTFPDNSTVSGTADAGGHYSVASGTPQNSGTVSITATDAAGNTGAPATATYTASAPAAPAILSYHDDVGLYQGNFNSGTFTDDTKPTLQGTAVANSTVTISEGGTVLGTAIADASGNWNYPVTTALSEGVHQFTATASTTGSAESNPSATFTLTVDTTAPAAPATPSFSVDSSSGDLIVSGTAEPGSTVTVIFPDNSTGHATADPNTGSYSVTSATMQGNGTVSVSATDAAGNHGAGTTVPYAMVIPTISSTEQNADGTLTVSGTAMRGDTITVLFSDGSTQTAVTDATGHYTATSAQALSLVGNPLMVSDLSGNSVTLYFVTPLPPPAPPDPTFSLSGSGDLIVSGTAEPGSTVTVIFPDNSTGHATADPNTGSYSVTSATMQGNGTVSVSATDAAGNHGAGTTVSYEASAIAPQAPAISTFTQNADGTLTVSGTATPGDTVTVVFADHSSNSVTADPGTGQYAIASPGVQTTGTVSVTATDPGSHLSSSATTQTWTDTTPPQAPIIIVSLSSEGDLIVSGTAERGSTVMVIFPDGTSSTTTADPSTGHYSVTSATAQDSDHAIAVWAIDAAGNVSHPNESIYDPSSTATPASTIGKVEQNANGTLDLSLADVLNGVSGGTTTPLTIRSGGAVSTIDLTDGIGTGAGQWQDTGMTFVNGVPYHVYHNVSQGANTAANLLIQQGLSVI